jgi:hypothetical protein
MTRGIKNSANEETKTVKTPAKTRGKSTGRKPLSSAIVEIEPAEPGQGAKRLRSSVNSIVSAQSDDIARALYKRALAGNTSCARLLIELAGEPPAEETTHNGLTIFDLLPSDADDVDVGDGTIQTIEGNVYKRLEDLTGIDVNKLPYDVPKNPNDPRRRAPHSDALEDPSPWWEKRAA